MWSVGSGTEGVKNVDKMAGKDAVVSGQHRRERQRNGSGQTTE